MSSSVTSTEEEGEAEKVSRWKKAVSRRNKPRSPDGDLEGSRGRTKGDRVSGQCETSRGEQRAFIVRRQSLHFSKSLSKVAQ